MTQSSRIYFTTAIDYVNSLPHIGTAYEKIGADVLARHYRLLGCDVRLQMGNDEHSANVQKAAEAKGMEPKKYCDDMRPKFEEIWKRLNISNDDFIQTSEPRHHAAVLRFFELVNAQGDIYEKDYEGWYCESCEAFYLEKDLADGLCPNHKNKPKWLKEKNYFFKLSRYAQALYDKISSGELLILPEKRRNEVLKFIGEPGDFKLEDFSISRSTFSWGIPVPLNPKHVFYVWFDALINYVTGIGFGSDDKMFGDWWPHVTHIVGKDITRFHCIIWPAMLMSAGIALPKRVFGHGFVYLRGEKMSKSLGNVVTPLDFLQKYPEFGADALRYYLMRTSSFGDDADFTWDGFVERYNADLANGIGNLASRILGMVWKYQGGTINPISVKSNIGFSDFVAGQVLFDGVGNWLDPLKNSHQDICTHFALEYIWRHISSVDEFIDKSAPWKLFKESRLDDLSNCLTALVHQIGVLVVLMKAFIPDACRKIWDAYNFSSGKDFDSLTREDLANMPMPKNLKEQKLNLFPRIEMEKNMNNEQQADASVQKPVAVIPQPAASAAQTGVVNLIEIGDFGKIDLRVAKVISAQKVEKADKLLLLQVQLGEETRQIVSGIAEYYKPEEMVGKNIVVVANLKPAKIRGIESFGMLIAAKAGGKLVLVSPEQEIDTNAKVG